MIPRFLSGGGVAQLVEQRTENPCVGGSIPSLATTKFAGGLAQLGERLNGIQEVVGSTPIPSTKFYVYVLQSLNTGRFYVGHCDHLIERFHEHQSGYSKATRHSQQPHKCPTP